MTPLSRGVYGAGSPEPLDALRALFARLPAGCAVSHHTAAELLGFGVLGRPGIHIAVPAGVARPRIKGVVCHEAVLDIAAIQVAGIPCVPAERSAIDLARTVRRLDALAVLDAALRAGACDPDALACEVIAHGGLRGVCQARELVPLADGRAECRQESHLRLVVIDGGLPCPEPQIWVPDGTGRPTYRLDLGYRAERVGLEYDGRSHLEPLRLAADRSRMNWLGARGWRMRYFTASDLYQSPGVIVATVRSALAA